MVQIKKRGQTAFVGLMLAFVFFIVVVVTIEPIKEGIEIAVAPDRLDCDNTSITTENEMTCIAAKSFLPAFIGMGLAVALGYLGIRKLQEEGTFQ